MLSQLMKTMEIHFPLEKCHAHFFKLLFWLMTQDVREMLLRVIFRMVSYFNCRQGANVSCWLY